LRKGDKFERIHHGWAFVLDLFSLFQKLFLHAFPSKSKQKRKSVTYSAASTDVSLTLKHWTRKEELVMVGWLAAIILSKFSKSVIVHLAAKVIEFVLPNAWSPSFST
jgi:hypothetical protein